MRVVLNGKPRELPERATVARAVEEAGVEAAVGGVAVAVDGAVVPRGEWERRAIEAGQRVEVVRAVQGG